jgi:methylmalonyl-CoA/ethylmalonyl-CoA epimerase
VAAADETIVEGGAARLDVGNALVEILDDRARDGDIAASLGQRGPGLFGIRVEVDDLEAAVIDLRAKGVKVTDAAGAGAGSRVALIEPASANGVRVELVERSRS